MLLGLEVMEMVEIVLHYLDSLAHRHFQVELAVPELTQVAALLQILCSK